MARYYPYRSDGSHGMENAIGREVLASTFYKVYNDDGALAKPNNWLFLTGFDYTFKADGADKDKTADWHIDFSIFDDDGDFTDHILELDVNPGSAYKASNFYVDPITGDLVGLGANGNVVVIDTTIVGNTLTYSIDNEVLQDLTGLGGNVIGKFGGEHFGADDCDSFFQINITR